MKKGGARVGARLLHRKKERTIMKSMERKNGLFTLTGQARESLTGSGYYNGDLAPTSFEKRNWNAYNIACCWVGMNVCIPAYQMASSAITMGLNWWMALLLVLLGNLIILIPIQLNSSVGTKYGIPFPVFARLSFGLRGAQIPSILRSILGAGWTGILIWTGAESLQVAMCVLFPAWGDFEAGQWIMFAIFWALNIGIAYAGDSVMKKFESLSAPLLGIVCGALFIWAVYATFRSGYGFAAPLTSVSIEMEDSFGTVFVACLVANIAYYSTWALNIPDLSRYAKSQKAQMRGQLYGMPTSMFAIAFIGVYVTGASQLVFGEAMWDPNTIIEAIGSPVAAVFGALGISLATLTTNVTTNILPPSNGIANLFPKKIDFRKGVLITGLIVLIMRPWNLVSDPSGYIYDWLGTYGALTGPVASIFIYDYFFLRKQRLSLSELYQERESRYWYKYGFNFRALLAWAAAIALPVLGKFVPALEVFSLYGWIVSFLLGFVFYPLFMLGEKKSILSAEEEMELTEESQDGGQEKQSAY